MNTITSIINFTPEHSLEQNEINNILKELINLKGLRSLNVDKYNVNIEFYHNSLSPDLLKDALVKAGFPFKNSTEKKNLFTRFITTLAKDNNETFGGKTPSCCGH